jgi:hypothetical protein
MSKEKMEPTLMDNMLASLNKSEEAFDTVLVHKQTTTTELTKIVNNVCSGLLSQPSLTKEQVNLLALLLSYSYLK